MIRAFIDTDVILDFLTDRKPFSTNAAKIFSLAETKKINLFTSGLVFANAYYVLRKLAKHSKVIDKLRLLAELVSIVSIDKTAVLKALKSDFKDFEDSIQNYSAYNADLQVLITRNLKDFKESELSIVDPDAFMRMVERE